VNDRLQAAEKDSFLQKKTSNSESKQQENT